MLSTVLAATECPRSHRARSSAVVATAWRNEQSQLAPAAPQLNCPFPLVVASPESSSQAKPLKAPKGGGKEYSEEDKAHLERKKAEEKALAAAAAALKKKK